MNASPSKRTLPHKHPPVTGTASSFAMVFLLLAR
jgi:hypothetical protein